VIAWRFDEDIRERLADLKWWDWEPDRVIAAWPLLSSELDADIMARLEAGDID
jgi:hypothetical protein